MNKPFKLFLSDLIDESGIDPASIYKLPFMQFYPADWLAATRGLSLACQGAWIATLARLWESPIRGMMGLSMREWSLFWGTSLEGAEEIVAELRANRVAEITRDGDQVVIVSRRLVREELSRESERNRKRDSRNSTLEQSDVYSSWLALALHSYSPRLANALKLPCPESVPGNVREVSGECPPYARASSQKLRNSETQKNGGGDKGPQDPIFVERESGVAVADLLVEFGLTKKQASWLASHHSEEVVRQQLDRHQFRKGLRNEASALIKAIEENWPAPKGYKPPEERKREAELAAKEAEEKEAKRKARENRAKQKLSEQEANEQLIDDLIANLSESDRNRLNAEARRRVIGKKSAVAIQAMVRNLVAEEAGILVS